MKATSQLTDTGKLPEAPTIQFRRYWGWGAAPLTPEAAASPEIVSIMEAAKRIDMKNIEMTPEGALRRCNPPLINNYDDIVANAMGQGSMARMHVLQPQRILNGALKVHYAWPYSKFHVLPKPLTRSERFKRRLTDYGERVVLAWQVLRGDDIHENCDY